MSIQVTSYRMNPAEDVILFGHELTEGMWVLPEYPGMRSNTDASEDAQLRGQRFRRVTWLSAPREIPGGVPPQITFIGEWVDGYQEVCSGAVTLAWLVKKDSLPEATS